MLKVDLHSHSNYSNCGMHTIMEIIYHAKTIGLEIIAITDHGYASKGRLCARLFDRFENPVKGITFLKGVECNVLKDASLDLPAFPINQLDIVLFGLHAMIPENLGAKYYTDLLIETIKTNSCGSIITHPNHKSYPLEFERLVPIAKKYNVALELNNACSLLKKDDPEVTIKMLSICKESECLIAVNSDAHTLNELGQCSSVNPYLKDLDFPEELIINSTPEKALNFLKR